MAKLPKHIQAKSAEYQAAYKEYISLAKKADQRLVRIEKYSQQEYYKGVKSYSYKRALEDIKHWSGKDAKRFNTKPPERFDSLQAKIRDIKQFLESKTSTKKGIKEMYQKRADTLNENQGTNFTWQEIARYFEKSSTKTLEGVYSSGVLLRASYIIKRDKITAKNVDKVLAEDDRLEDEELYDNVIKKLTAQGLNYKNLF